MKTVDVNMWHRLDKLDYDSIGIIQATNNITGEVSLELVKRKDFEKENPGCCVCPTYEMVVEWLRNKHNIVISVTPRYLRQSDQIVYIGCAYRIRTYDNKERLSNLLWRIRDSYDDALDAIVDKSLSILEKGLNNE